MKERVKIHPLWVSLTLLYILGLFFFYIKYVPLVRTFQIALMPILLGSVIITAVDLRRGLLFFIFSFPLLSGLPNFFGIFGEVPHAPVALVLFLFFFLGCLFHWVFKPPNIKLDYPIFKPMILLSLVIFFSEVVTILRHLDFFHF